MFEQGTSYVPLSRLYLHYPEQLHLEHLFFVVTNFLVLAKDADAVKYGVSDCLEVSIVNATIITAATATIEISTFTVFLIFIAFTVHFEVLFLSVT